MTLARLLGRFDGSTLEVDGTWINSWGVVFGGVPTAALLDAWSRQLDPEHALASVHLSFARPLRGGPAGVETGEATGGRTVQRLDGEVVQDERVAVQGFALAVRRAGATTSTTGAAPTVPAPDDLPEAVDRTSGRTAAFIEHHVEIRVVRQPSADNRTITQWVRLRNLEPDGDGHVPPAAIGLLADLASVGAFRTAVRELDGLHAAKALDLGLHLTGRALGEWTLMVATTPPIHEGTAVASAAFYDQGGAPLATATQQTLVQPV